ncbi:hypothetical protein H6503_01525 [Candidatus Woesearchaeota archaeon]|nr:hypothetical protein [Candidatus Woesearchaeota archaeon]
MTYKTDIEARIGKRFEGFNLAFGACDGADHYVILAADSVFPYENITSRKNENMKILQEFNKQGNHRLFIGPNLEEIANFNAERVIGYDDCLARFSFGDTQVEFWNGIYNYASIRIRSRPELVKDTFVTKEYQKIITMHYCWGEEFFVPAEMMIEEMSE